jgi:hypothetical protein
MPKLIRSLLTASLFLLASVDVGAGEGSMPRGPSIIGIDHIPTLVENLEAATASFEHLGFSLKPGRMHGNGLRNNHVKFKDGSGVELIALPAQQTDDLTRTYAELLRGGEGPPYVSFHARDTDALTSSLSKAGMLFESEAGLITLKDPNLDFIFFVQDNRSPTDKPKHFAHPNTAFAMSEVWLSLDAPRRKSLRKLLLALGAAKSNELVRAPTEVRAEVFTVQNGRVVVVDDKQQLRKDRRIIGVAFRVREAQVARRFLGAVPASAAPSLLHGLWLRFDQRP